MNIIEKYNDKIKGILTGFDRIIINGYSRQLNNCRQFLYYMIQNKCNLVDFNKFAEEHTKSLCEHIDKLVSEQNRPTEFIMSSKVSKDEVARKLFNENPIKEGLVCCISAMEVCDTMTVKGNKKTKSLEVTRRPTKCKYYYLYMIDKDFGWMYLKIQTWFPFNVQLYLNGREYICKQLDKEGIKYERYNNSLIDIENIERAQEISDHLQNIDLTRKFDGLVSKYNNLLPRFEEILGHGYFWTVFECEYATDIMFKTREDLENIFPSLVEKSFFTFKCDDIMSFFGRKLDSKFQGEIVSDARKRYQGFRIKHKMKSNQVKMYDKYSCLRIETTINDPREFKILKETEKIIDHKVITTEKHWVPMGKSITNLYRYAEVSKATNLRYINALPLPVDNMTPVKEIENISKSIEINNRHISGFNILNCETTKLLETIASGDYIVNGITNKTLRNRIFKDEDFNSTRIRNKTTRLLNKLKNHGIIKKVNHSSKYYLTTKGRKIINSILLFKNIDLPNNYA